ncbi:deaminase [Caulobacter mirabilis]|uniref:Deaminase n=1 Tax=Caulobacter mirabilis TaxID=69666 RepID=A0A2D2AXR3_9CAUL|nr:RibD family protein [Caulobacter mirabilis]ATQ42773.1 deaminase [Caulobacter mirabilis]
MTLSVTLKLATSLDGRIATASGESRWITGPAAREQVHRLRAMHQAVLVGIETAIADDPELTVRLPGYVGHQPVRVVLDSRQRLPLTSKLVREAGRLPTVVITVQNPNDRLTDAGVTVIQVAESDGRLDMRAALTALSAFLKAHQPAALDVEPQLFVEGGGQVAASLLAAGLVDRLEWFRAPIVLGDEGRPGVGAFVLKDLAAAPRFRRVAVEAVGDDLWERYEKA